MKNRERGSAMLVTMILIVALLAGAAVLVSMQLASNKSSELARTNNGALYCAEAGLTTAQGVLLTNATQWAGTSTETNLHSNTTTKQGEPSWLSTAIGSHDIDGDGVADFEVWLVDNEDEIAPTANNPAADIDSKVFLVSRCPPLSATTHKFLETPKTVMALVSGSVGGGCYASQEGGCQGNGNSN